MDLDKIVSDLVEKRFADAVRAAVGECIWGERDSSDLANVLRERIKVLLKEEIAKRDEEIRAVINATITDQLTKQKIEINVTTSRY